MGVAKGTKLPSVGVTIRKKYGEDYYQRIGRMGGKVSTTGGFYADRKLASEAGKKGGAISRLPKKETT